MPAARGLLGGTLASEAARRALGGGQAAEGGRLAGQS